MNIVLSLLVVGILFVALGIQQHLMSAMTESLIDTFGFSQWYVSTLFSVAAAPAFLVTIAASRQLSRLTLRTCHRIGGVLCAGGIVSAFVMFYVDYPMLRMGAALLSQLLAGFGWVMLKSSTNLILNNRCSKAHLYVRYSLWNVVALFTFVGIACAYLFVPGIIAYSPHAMAFALLVMLVLMFGAVYISPYVFAGYIDMAWKETAINPPPQHVMHIAFVALHNMLTFGMWSAFLLYLPEIILRYKDTMVVDMSLLSFSLCCGIALAFGLSLLINTKRRWLAAVLSTTLLAIAGCLMMILDSFNPTFGIFVLTLACCCFYTLPTVASNALFFGDMLNTAFIWLDASRLLAVIVFPQLFTLWAIDVDAVLIGVMLVLLASLFPAYIVYRFLSVMKDDEFAQRNRNFSELVSGDADTHKEKRDVEDGTDEKGLKLNTLLDNFNMNGDTEIAAEVPVAVQEKQDYFANY